MQYSLRAKKNEMKKKIQVAEIIDISSDNANRFIATADKKFAIIVWDLKANGPVAVDIERPIVIRSIESPFGNEGIGAIAMSYNAKYLAAISGAHQKCCLKFWLWSYGNDEADYEVKLPPRFGAVKRMHFNRNAHQAHMMVATFVNGIAFFEWDCVIEKIRVHIPDRSFINVIEDSIYLENSRKVISITSTGHAIVWSDAPTDDNPTKVSFEKEFSKSLKLGNSPLTCIQNFDNIIVIGDEAGKLKFYDYSLKLMYWCRHLDTNVPILCISSNPMRRVYKIVESVNYVSTAAAERDAEELLYEPLIPRDFSVEENHFIVRDFLITTADGKVLAINFIDGLYRELYYQSEDIIVAMDVHPMKEWLCVATKNGRIIQYDTKMKALNLEITMKFPAHTLINELKFSDEGMHLVMSTNQGTLYELDTEILAPFKDNPYTFSKYSITKMKFSDDSKFLALSDVHHEVTLLYFCSKRWLLIGKNSFHQKPICGLIFIQNVLETPRLLSIGSDFVSTFKKLNLRIFEKIIHKFQMLVEYDVDHALSTGQLVTIRSTRYDQSSIPRFVSLLPIDILPILNLHGYEDVLLITDNQMKIKLLDANSGSILFTFLGPIFGGYLNNWLVNFLFLNNHKLKLFS